MGYVVVDTEGETLLHVIAIVDSTGKVIYEKFVEGDLAQTLEAVRPLLESHIVVAHYAHHDVQVIQRSYRSIGQTIQLQSVCTYEMARAILDTAEGYDLAHLSTALLLQHEGKYFDADLAHRASYDALFTYHLYGRLRAIETSRRRAKNINVFSSTKVDNPFQSHFDDASLYAEEFGVLLRLLDEIRHDPNHQTRSAVVLAEAGNGKTHLMMRFVQHVSQTNRFLFVGKPNDKENILLHIYLKMLESFIQKIDGSDYTQLQYLLAKSFTRIVLERNPNKRIREILEANPLHIYTLMGKEGTERRKQNWRYIEKAMHAWYTHSYGSDALSLQILKALVKYTSYVDDTYRHRVIDYLSAKEMDPEVLAMIGLEPREQSFNKEVFSLMAISLFGKLSIFDEPLIISFDQMEAMSGEGALVERFFQNLKEMITQTPNALVILNLFPNRWREYEAMFDGSIIDLLGKTQVVLERPSHPAMRQMLISRAQANGIDLPAIFTDPRIYNDILRHNTIRRVLNRAHDHFQHIVHGVPLPKRGAVSVEEQLQQLIDRVAHLESLHAIISTPPEAPVDFDIQRYITKTYESKKAAHGNVTIIDDKNDVDRLKFICESIQEMYPMKLDFFKAKKVLPEHVIVERGAYTYVIAFLHLGGKAFVSRIKNFNQRVIQHPDYQFRVFRDSREATIRGRVSTDEILKLRNAPNGDFLMMDREGRVIYETLYQLVVDYKNKDIESVTLAALMEGACTMFKDFWFCRLMTTP